MKNKYLLLALFALGSGVALSQDQLTKDFDPIRNELTAWDNIRGPWLANSLDSMMRGKQIPDRNFPENFTPVEMYKVVPERHREFISDYALKQRINSGKSQVNSVEWSRLNQVVQIPNCRPSSGRSYGDPHLVSFDGETYSFQTVGEFVLAGSTTSDFMIQTRQKAVGDNFSLNMAVAMNVAGDRVGFYVEDNPTSCGNSFSRSDSPMLINGQSFDLDNGGVYFLAHGGTISRSGNDYTVTWPTGEKLVAGVRNSGAGSNNGFINCSVEVYSCTNSYFGLLGNANGRGSDDFDVRGMKTPPMLAFSTFGGQSLNRGSNIAEKEYLAFLAKDFARQYRITQEASLFDYCMGRNTFSFTDESFPRVHLTLDDLSQDQQDRARQNCRDRGILDADMRGCVFDQAFISLPPSPRPVINDPTVDYKPKPLDREIPNVNNRPQPMTTKPITGSKGDAPKPSIRPDLLEEKPSRTSEPIPAKPSKEISADPVEKPSKVEEDRSPVSKPTIIGDDNEEPVKKPSIFNTPEQKSPELKPKTPTPSEPKPKPVTPSKNSGIAAPKPKAPIGTGGSMIKGGK